jgi:hypothetical protein
VSPAALGRIVAKKHVAAEVGKASEQVRVLARWNDGQGHPAVVEKRFGKGCVLLWTVTADRQWSDWPIDPTYVLAVRSAASAVARPDVGAGDLSAGQPIRIELPMGAQASDVKVTPPGSSEAQAVRVEQGTDTTPTVLTFARTPRAGVYPFTWKDAAGAEQSRPVCVNPDKAESDLDPITDGQLAELLSPLRVPVVHYAAGQTLLTREGKEVWRTLVTAVLVMGVVESLFAVWVGREQ